MSSIYRERVAIYDSIVDLCPRFERKGKTMPYTSANGYMFSLLNKEAELGIRFSKDVQEKYIASIPTSHFRSHGAELKGYVLIPNAMLDDKKTLARMLNESYDYVMSLKPK